VPRLLIVEDYPPLATVLAITFQRLGYTVERVGRVERARQTTAVHDHAIIDIELPDGDGVELAAALVASGRARHVVFFTATRDAHRIHLAEQIGPVVDKDGGVDHLVAVVERELSPSARTRELARAVGGADLDVETSDRSGTRPRVR
jgi:DNA-binding response OmpR family regulator